MTLEDHLGDVITKGRNSKGMAPEQAANAGGMSVMELISLEQTGTWNGNGNLGGLASALGLDPIKLQRLAQGWLPRAPELSAWREIRQLTTTAEGMTVHCYLIWDEVSREAALFDTGWEEAPILDAVQENGLTVRHIFLTHSHVDHIAALEPLRKAFPKALLHTNCKNAPPQHRNRTNDFVHLGSLRITNRDTPGHAEDGVTYIIGNWAEDAPHVAIVGDAIFAGSMGSGKISWEVAKQKVQAQILSLPPDTLLCPGHGPFSTVGEEKENNPFF